MRLLIIIFLLSVTWSASAQPFSLLLGAGFASAGGSESGGSGGGGSSGFPQSLTNLQLFVGADSLTNYSEGAVVTNWVSSATNHPTWFATNSIEAEAPFLTNSFAGISGKKALVFTKVGATNRLYFPNAINVTRNVDDCSIVAVSRVDDTATTKILLAINGSSGSERQGLRWANDERPQTLQRSANESASYATDYGISSVVNPLILCADFIHTNRVAVTGSRQLIYTNNVLATNIASTAIPTNTLDVAADSVILGDSSRTSANGAFVGHVAALLVFVPRLTDSDRTNVYNWARTNYAQ